MEDTLSQAAKAVVWLREGAVILVITGGVPAAGIVAAIRGPLNDNLEMDLQGARKREEMAHV